MRTLFTLISVPFSENLHPQVTHPHSPRRASAGATEVALEGEDGDGEHGRGEQPERDSRVGHRVLDAHFEEQGRHLQAEEARRSEATLMSVQPTLQKGLCRILPVNALHGS